jgi:hypothetical protein
MRLLATASTRKLLAAMALAAFLAFASTPSQAQDDDPPAQAGRLSYVTGAVSIQQVGSDNWNQAVPNLPLGPGDRVFTDSDGRAEIQVGQTYVRMGPSSDVSLVEASPRHLVFGVAQGSVHLHSLGMWPDQAVSVSTPSGNGSFAEPGEFRIDVLPADDAAIFTNIHNVLHVTGAGGFDQYVINGQALELVGSNPVVPQWLAQASYDDLDQFSHRRDEAIEHAASYRYVSREIPGVEELDANGEWMPDSDYGPVWFPRNVPAGWAPYHYGHWVNHAPWGWVWVEDEPWGYAPFHYGRWVNLEGRWGWIPGAPTAHPVWSPALVAFAGGIHVGGLGVSVWFPLGPGEAYHPWYHASPRYFDEVNRSNISESRRVHVQNTYVNVVNVTNVTNITYVNRTIGVSAMSHEDFASGRPAQKANVVVDVHLMDHVQVIDRPEVKQVAVTVNAHPPVRPVPVKAERPALINDSGKLVSAKPGAVPVAPPVKPAPQVRALPGHTVVAPPPTAKPQPPAPAAAKPTAAPAAPGKPAPTVAAPAPAKPAPQLAAPTAVKPAPPAPGKQPAPAAPQAAPKPNAPPAPKPAAPAAAPTPKPAAPAPTAPAPKAVAPAPKPAAPAAAPAPKPSAPPATKPAATAPAPKAAAPAPAKPAAAPATKPEKDKAKKDEPKTNN